MDMRVCKKCGEEKPSNFEFFYKTANGGLDSYCKICRRQQAKEWQTKNADRHNEQKKSCDQRHKEERAQYAKAYREKNIDRYRSYQRDYFKKRFSEDALFRFEKRIRSNLYYAFSENGHKKRNSTFNIVGCSRKMLIEHLLNSYSDNYGVEWDGKEKVHIDHIIPLSTASSENDIIKLCHYTNLQLLKAEDNLLKGSKTNYEK